MNINEFYVVNVYRNAHVSLINYRIYLDSSPNEINVKKRHWRMNGVGGVFICGYDKFKNLMGEDKNTFEGCDILICDEGHILKNSRTIKNTQVNNVKTPYRIILSGTPLQNNLVECKLNVDHDFTLTVYMYIIKNLMYSSHIFFNSRLYNDEVYKRKRLGGIIRS